MTKQEFMAMSLPFGLKAKNRNEKGHIHNVDHYMYQYICDSEKDKDLYKYDLILHPLSDLTKEIEHGCEKFVPSKLLSGGHGSIEFKCSFIFNNSISIYEVNFWIIQKLIEWHFDVACLIEKGEAIDVNKLEENPYK